MTRDSTECFNCGRENPSWAQVCRYCGVPLREGEAAAVPTGPFPTDQRSLLSLGAAVGTILVAIVVGLFVANLNPVDPSVGLDSPTPRPSVVVRPSASAAAEPTATTKPTPAPTPPLPGTLTFGTGRSKGCAITGETDTFGPGSVFAHAITVKEAFGVKSVAEEVVLIGADGKEKVVQTKKDGITDVNSKQKVACYAVASNNLIRAWGAGTFVMRVYRGDEKLAEGKFTLTK
jgi:hypothetical protein